MSVKDKLPLGGPSRGNAQRSGLFGNNKFWKSNAWVRSAHVAKRERLPLADCEEQSDAVFIGEGCGNGLFVEGDEFAAQAA